MVNNLAIKIMSTEQLKFEKPQEGSGIIKEELLALRENEAFLSFVERFKSLQQEAEKEGIDINKAISYLETGQGTPDLVERALSDLRQKDVDRFKQAAESSGRPLSEEEITEIGQKTPYGKILEDFKFFTGLPKMKKKVEAKSVSRSGPEFVGDITLKKILESKSEGIEQGKKMISPEWEDKVLDARREFQADMIKELEKYAELWQNQEGLTPEIRKKIGFYMRLLTEKAATLALQHRINLGEIFTPEKDFKWYIGKEYTERY